MSRLFFLGRGASPPQRPPILVFVSLLLAAGCPDPKDGAVDTDTAPVVDDTGGCGDADFDGWCVSEGDCDESNSDVNPGATEACNGVDDNCDGEVDEGVESTYYADTDGDGFGDLGASIEACEVPPLYVSNANDCDDTSADKFPGNTEACDELDNDCDEVIDEDVVTTRYIDADGDGFGDPVMPVDTCEALDGTVVDATDCVDTDATIHPGAPETCDDVDQDCDGAVDEDATDEPTWFLDYDGDGYGSDRVSSVGCDAPGGYVDNAEDCDDTSADVSPGATETCDGADEDCDGEVDEGLTYGTWYTDADRDGHGDATTAVVTCSPASGAVSVGDDCDDTSADVSPSADETCDGTDEDCSGSIDDGGVCPCDVVEYAGHAYQLCTDAVTWSAAADACEADGYALASVTSAEEDAFLRIAIAGYGASYNWWMGYSDLASEGTWRWEDGSTSTYTNWNTDEPNDLFGEDCGTFAFEGNRWNDWYCDRTTSYLCESG